MLSDDDARRLLAKAGDTIEVSATSPTVPRSHRRWPVLLASAAVVAVIAAGVWLPRPAEQDVPAPAAPSVTSGVPNGTVPSVFGHTVDSARELLRDAGLVVRTKDKPSCPPEGLPIGTIPTTGSPVGPGDEVVLEVSTPYALADCFGPDPLAWDFLHFANGHGPAPGFANEVTLVVDNEEVGRLTGDQAGDPSRWGPVSALTELRAASAEVMSLTVDGTVEYRTPGLGARQGTPADDLCGVARPAVVGEREALTLSVDIPVDGIFHCPATVALYRTDGLIDTVVTWTEKPVARAAAPEPIPDVVGLELDDARRAVTEAGYAARVEEVQACDPRVSVVEQAPTQQDVKDDAEDEAGRVEVVTLVVEVPHTTRDCAGVAAAAQGFLRFARGGQPPAWAPEVRLLLGYVEQTTIPDEQADDPASWALCSGVDPTRCPLSAVDVAGEGDVAVADRATDDIDYAGDVFPFDCLIDLGGLPGELYEMDSIVLRPEAVGDCIDWVVELWIDDDGRIRAVNLRVPQD